MQSAQLQTLSESPLAAKPQLSEKPRLGFETKKTAGKPGPSVCNFIVTLGLRATVIENGVRKTYSARYYNPATGRFLSRDPLDGQAKIPASLHKYLYANGDPINGIDPMGREDMFETGALLERDARKAALSTAAYAVCVSKVWIDIEKLLSGKDVFFTTQTLGTDALSCLVSFAAALYFGG